MWVWIGMEKETTGGQWRFADGSDVPTNFEYHWEGGKRGLPSDNSRAGYDFMLVCCGGYFSGTLANYIDNSDRYFICQEQ